ncbi:MAG: DegT/DnrJ/EryC1/StrS aminotransferase family protein [Candidatus Chisholmbacteria bacterium]|nr:DegT/DnrJ/EryC1/StrS aminotransferase family protein [Candidatus Chisholmbacteria bacterium]
MSHRIPVSQPLLNPQSKRYLADCIDTGWVSSQGPYVAKFETAFAKLIGTKYAVSCTSGTAALHLALAALGIGPGDEVILPAFTMIAPAFAILYTGATPVLADVDPTTFTLNPDLVAQKITPRTRALIAVHLYGHPAEMSPLQDLARRHHLSLIEDAAEGLGSTYQGKKVGSLGDLACFSFYANKLITTGEGGMVVTNNATIAKKLRSLKDMAHSPKRRFLHLSLGFNYRFTNLQAALGLAQLAFLPRIVRAKRQLAARYTRELRHHQDLILPQEQSWAKSSFWMYALRVTRQRQKLMSFLKNHGIDTRSFFIPLHRQPVFKKLHLFTHERYPVAEIISQEGLYLPSGPHLSLQDQTTVCRTIAAFYAKV